MKIVSKEPTLWSQGHDKFVGLILDRPDSETSSSSSMDF